MPTNRSPLGASYSIIESFNNKIIIIKSLEFVILLGLIMILIFSPYQNTLFSAIKFSLITLISYIAYYFLISPRFSPLITLYIDYTKRNCLKVLNKKINTFDGQLEWKIIPSKNYAINRDAILLSFNKNGMSTLLTTSFSNDLHPHFNKFSDNLDIKTIRALIIDPRTDLTSIGFKQIQLLINDNYDPASLILSTLEKKW